MPETQTPQELSRWERETLDQYGEVQDIQPILDAAEARSINAGVLVEQGFPDKAETEDLAANTVNAQASFLIKHYGLEDPRKVA